MKKTLTVNLNGRVFNIDEDAYQLLEKYLENLRIYFRKEEGSDEILADFEARIEELFSNRVRLGYNVINIEEVEKVIAQMGQPGEFGDKDLSEEEDLKTENQDSTKTKKKLFRNPDDKVVCGIFSGIAAYFEWNVLALRIIAIILIFATSFWIIPVYLIAWLILPEAYSAERKLQMRGKPITVENIGKTVAEGVDAEKKKGQQGCLSFLIGFLKVSLISLGIVIGIPLLILFVLIIFFLVLLLGIGKDYSLFLDSILDFSVNPLILIVIISCIIGIPIITFIYMCIARLLNLKPLHKGVRWTGLIIWIIALISLFFVKLSPYVRSDFHSVDMIEGNGVIEEKEMIFPLIEKIKMRDINVNVQIEQIKEGDDSVLISGDSNLLEYLQLKNDDGLLEIRSSTRKPYKPTVPSIVRVRSKNINELTLKSLGNINLPQAFYGDELQINMEGAGMITADSLYVQKLNVKSEGIGSVTLVGQTKNATFDVEGAGIIRAFDLGVDSVRAQLDGVGSIQCNPSLYLDGTVDGIGEIVYTQEPKSKNISFSGMGKIGLH